MDAVAVGQRTSDAERRLSVRVFQSGDTMHRTKHQLEPRVAAYHGR